MIFKEYLILFRKTPGSIVYCFDENGRFVGMKIDAELTESQHAHICMKVPVTVLDLTKLAKELRWIMKEVQQDLSFDRFWNEYAYKTGNKKRAMKLWERLSKTNKIRALAWIPTYEVELRNNRVAKLYPETYLSQQRWNN